MSAAPIAAPANKKIEKVEKTREVRLGLVMYGGVSLAIYINGVAHELFRAVRGRGVYRLIKRLTRSDVSVDVLSGTSAGGINGIFLAYALCNRVEFGACAALWREHGDIDKLLRKTDAPAEEYTSLLDSEGFYHPKLIGAFAAMAGKPCEEYEGPEDVTAVPELDLMVTGTDFNGRVYDTVDDRGNVIQVKDHRTVFWLKHRADRKHPFEPAALPGDAPAKTAAKAGRGDAPSDTHEALAKLARITSCFPAAFAPVTISADGQGADARLRLWGGLDGNVDRVFIDGGVLDNKPFTSTLDAIYHRTAVRPVARHLMFVEPDPERFERDAKPVVPSPIRAAVDSLTRLPGYESIAGDLQSLAAHNDQVERLKGIANVAGNLAPPAPGQATIADEIYRRARLSGFADGVLSELFQRSVDGASRASLSALRTWFEARWVKPTGEGRELLEIFDVDLRLRRLLTLSYACEPELLALEQPLLQTLNNQVQVLEMVRGALQAVVRKVALAPPGTEETTWERVQEAATRVLAVAPPEEYENPNPAEELLDDETRKALKKKLDGAVAWKGDEPVGAPLFLRKADQFVDRLLAAIARMQLAPGTAKAIDTLVASDAGFAGRDRLLYPLEVVSGIHEKDVIHTVRISPRDARDGLSDKELERKVTGANVGHFGAFFKRSWRSNDILWGRLDAACELVDTLLDVDRLEALCASGGWRPSGPELRDYLPHLPDDSYARLAAALGRMTDRKAIEAELPDVKRLLIDAAHREILVEGLPQVVEDAAEQQMLWNEYNGRTVQRPARTSGFRAGAETLDPAVIAVASAEIARGVVGAMSAERPPERLVAFFKNEYAVGEEKLDDIPRVVLLDIVARALLVVRNNLIQAAGPGAQKLTSSLVYKVFLDWPLRVLAALAGGLRRAPSGRRSFIIATLLYAALSGAVVYKTELQFEKLEGWGPGLFVGLPLLMLAASSFLMSFRNGASLAEKAGRLLWTLVKVGGLAALVGVLVGLWIASPDQLCSSVGGAIVDDTKFVCTSGMVALTKAGKVLVFAAVLLTPIAGVWAWGRRTIARRQATRRMKQKERAWEKVVEARAVAAGRATEEIGVRPGVM